jgi:hypothetical protein
LKRESILPTLGAVAEYWQFLGRSVTVRYRVGEILVSATGTFSADSGRSIFLEQHIEQRGSLKYFRWEIPYPYIYRIEPQVDEVIPAGLDVNAKLDSIPKAAAAAGDSASKAASVIPFPQKPKTA